MICHNCGSKEIYEVEGYKTVYTCHGCHKTGNINEFKEQYEDHLFFLLAFNMGQGGF